MAMDHSAMMQGMAGGMHGGHMSGATMPGMAAMDLNDIEYDAYLANDRTLGDPQVVHTEKGGRDRLGIINGATATAFTTDTGSLNGRLVAVDGQAVQPFPGNRFPISMGQRLDILLDLPKTGGAHPVFALRVGAPERTGSRPSRRSTFRTDARWQHGRLTTKIRIRPRGGLVFCSKGPVVLLTTSISFCLKHPIVREEIRRDAGQL
ncbi:hypothetical protein D9M72_332030 [compost metagenome]